MSEDIADVARRLAENVESVCHYYLPAGKREVGQWRVGDIHNTLGRSLYVRLIGPTSGKGAAGRWRDAATGEAGDLIDLIRATRRLQSFAAALTEARRFLSIQASNRGRNSRNGGSSNDRPDFIASVRRLFAESSSIEGTLAQAYLRQRGIHAYPDLDALRFHARCPYRDPDTGQFSNWPAMLALVTDLDGKVTGLQRTYLSPKGDGKAALAAPRRSLGSIRGHGVHFGVIDNVAIYGEGVETILSLKCALPRVPMVAALSADNLGMCEIPATLQRLYVAIDPDAAGLRGANALLASACRAGIPVTKLVPLGDDFNADLMANGGDALRHHLAEQILAQDLQYLADESEGIAATERLDA
jgi:hypothetical protein